MIEEYDGEDRLVKVIGLEAWCAAFTKVHKISPQDWLNNWRNKLYPDTAHNRHLEAMCKLCQE